MSYKVLSERDIKSINTIRQGLDSDGYSLSADPFDSMALFSSIPSKDHIVIEQFKKEDAASQLIAWLVFLIVKSVNDIETGTCSLVCETLSQQFSSFVSRLRGLPGLSIETICFNITNWCEQMKSLVNHIDCNYHDDMVITNRGWGVDFTIRSLFDSIDRDKGCFFDELAESNYGRAFSSVVLYNFWGEEYSNKKKSIDFRLPLTTEDMEIINNRDNRNRFFYKCEQLFIYGETSHDIHPLSLFFEGLFKDYISRIHKEFPDNSVLSFAAFYWKTTTLIVLDRVSRHRPTMEEDGWMENFNSEDYISCYKAITDICERYLIRENSGSQYYEWSPTIELLNIQYADLYRLMTTGDDKFFIPSSLSLVDFKCGIEEANIKALYDAVEDFCKTNAKMNSGKLGCIKFLVSELGNQLGEKWFEKAAESICEKKGSEAKNYMRSHTDTLAIKAFSEVLHNTIPTLIRRKKSKRTIQ